MYKKNDELQLTITDLGSEGEGIGKIDGFPFFVKAAVPGDVIRAGVTKVKKNYAFARLIGITEASPDRKEPECPYFGKCGGCQLMHLSYDAQLRYKGDKVKNDLIRIGGLDRDMVESASEGIRGSEDTLHYRNKEQYPFGKDREGRTVCGFYAYHSHRIIAQTDCLLGNEENRVILENILSWMKENDIAPYDEETGKGIVRHVMIRKGNLTGELMVCIVINAQKLPKAESLVGKLSRIEGMSSLSYSVNRENTNVIMGESAVVIWGKESIETIMEKDGSRLMFALSPLAFYQINAKQTEKLYAKALEYAGLKGEETVWDLYCGIGTISLFLAKQAKKVYGVEIIPQAIENAKMNAVVNGITNAEFICGAAEKVLPAFYEDNGDHPDVVVVDPPRKGCDRVCLDTIIGAAPERVVYVSCDPATLARDVRILCDAGYELKKYAVFDMFPHSYHVETVVQLSKGDIDGHVSSEKKAVKSEASEIISGYRKGNKAPETTNVKIDFSLDNLDLSELKGR